MVTRDDILSSTYSSDVPFGVMLRLMMVFAPGYIHPDEFFQTQEVASKWVMGYDTFVPWEFSCENDGLLYRSVLPPLLSCGIPYEFLKLTWLRNSSLWVLVLPRMFIFGVSLIADRCVQRVFGPRTFYVYRSSWVSVILLARPLSNSLAVLLFVFCICAGWTRRPFLLGAITVAGVFIHITFIAFAIPVICLWALEESTFALQAYAKKHDNEDSEDESSSTQHTWIEKARIICPAMLPQILKLGLGTLLCFITFVAADSIYVSNHASCSAKFSPLPQWLSEPWEGVQITFTPLNNLIYNLEISNLAKHGLHPWYLHLLVNMQILFSPIWIFALLWTSPFNSRRRTAMFASLVLGVGLLSLAPHQEPRFLMPLIVPVAFLTTELVTRHTGVRVFWLWFNTILGIFYGFIHQGGVVPALLAIEGELFNEQSVRCIAMYETYMMPRFLFTNNAVTEIDLMSTPPDQIHRVLSEAKCSDNDWYFLFPNSARHDFPKLAKKIPVAEFFPHFSGERPPSNFEDLTLQLYKITLEEAEHF
mmetsp:Transcript_13538/g.26110  ORF Transcript_13538/g.26110 Transcript_13538/m.26110 type:complete len:533 (-) Transcript_13538:273-1871(-)